MVDCNRAFQTARRAETDRLKPPGQNILRQAALGSPQACRNALSQQDRVSAGHRVGAVHHRALQRARLHRDVFGEEARQRDVALRIAQTLTQGARRQRFFRELASAERRSEQPQIGCRARQRVVRRRGNALQQPSAAAFERTQRIAQLRAGCAEGGVVRNLNPLDDVAEFVEQRPHRSAALRRELARHQIDRLDAIGAFVDRGDARVAIVLRGAGFLDKTHAAVDLHAERGDFIADVGGERLCDRRQQRAARRGVAADLGVGGAHGNIERDGGGVADGARGGGERAHLHQHPLHVGVHDDGVRAVAGLADGAALSALLRECQRLLIGAVRDADAFKPDAEPRLVHHGEHAEHAAVFLADQVADSTSLVTHGHGAGRGSVHAELVLDAACVDVVALAERAIGVDEEFRDQKQRDALSAGGGIGQSRKHEMHDVVGHVVIAIGDEDLGAGDAIAAIGGAFGAGAQCADVGSRLRLGQLHGAGPFAGYQFLEIDFFEFVAAVRVERLDRAQRQQRAEAEGDIRGAPDLRAGRVDCQRQALAAKCFRSRHRIPPGGGPALIGVRPARRGRHLVIGELDAVLIANAIERRQHVGSKSPGFLEHRRGDVAVEVAVMAGPYGRLQAGAMIEREQHVVDRRAVGHDPGLA
jgi:hypothetical protein